MRTARGTPTLSGTSLSTIMFAKPAARYFWPASLGGGNFVEASPLPWHHAEVLPRDWASRFFSVVCGGATRGDFGIDFWPWADLR